MVLFLKHDSSFSSTYTYGMVVSVEYSNDNVARKAKVKYRNANEENFRETYLAIRSLVIIHCVDESDILSDIGLISLKIDMKSKFCM